MEFRPLARPDFPLLLRWLTAPHVREFFVGEPGRGLGTVMVAAFTALVFEQNPGVRAIVADPDERNAASCRVLGKAGYRRHGQLYRVERS